MKVADAGENYGSMADELTNTVVVNPQVSIPFEEISFTFSRSGGPGGQNVNKVNTRVTLHFDLNRSRALTDLHKMMLRKALPNRIHGDGVLRVVSGRHRTQGANRQAAIDRFVQLIFEALRPRTPRRATKPTRASRRAHLKDKRHRSEKKSFRGSVRKDHD